MSSDRRSFFTVSQLNQSVRLLLESEMRQVWISAEISNFTQPSSGHWYFTLKDNQAQVRCAMFRNQNRYLTFRPQNGQHVLVRATVTLYEPRGDYQLIAEMIQPAGEGLLQQQFEQLKQRLGQEGLFDQQYKQVLPRSPRCLGIITSASGAALHDILQVLKRRDPSLPIIIYPSLVQGTDAPLHLVQALQIANQRQECDVLIVGRGGGSLEDLWCFNDERVARAIFASQIPIVSAVGHETDITIADFVADLRAPTPSAAAELVSRNQEELLRQLSHVQQRLEMGLDYYLAQCQQRLARLTHRLQQQHPQLRLSRQLRTLEQTQHRLHDAMQKQLQRNKLQLGRYEQRLMQQQPLGQIYQQQQHVQLLQHRLEQHMQGRLGALRQRLSVACSQLDTVSPLATLARGYSVSETEQGGIVRRRQDVTAGDVIKTRLTDGWIRSQVLSDKYS